MAQYEKTGNDDIFTLGNEIAKKNAEYESIIEQSNQLKEKADNEASDNRKKISEFAQILMAIGNIESFCANRDGAAKTLIKHQVKAEKTSKHFDSFTDSAQYAEL